MPNLLTIPSELICEIISNLEPPATFYLLVTCRFLASLCAPAMLLHAVAPIGDMPALHWAAQKGHLPLVKYLVTRFPVDLPNGSGGTALQSAARSCHPLVTEYLLLRGAAVNRSKNNRWTALSWACRSTHTNEDAVLATVRVLIAHGAHVHGEASYRPLRNAVACCTPRVVRVLLDAGADPDEKGHAGEPLIIAAALQPEKSEIMELLLDYGADINATNDTFTNALMKAAEGGHLGVVRTLVDRGANLNLADVFGTTSFMYACMYKHQDIVEYLAGCEGLDITTSTLGEKAPVYQAVLYGYDVALRILLQRGALTQCLDDEGRSVLHTAVLRGRENIVHTLLQNGADTEWLDNSAFTPLMTAINIVNVPIATILLDHGPDPSLCSPADFETLMVACMRGSKTMVALLLQKGMDINMVDEDGLTVMAYAKKEGLVEVVWFLTSFVGVTE